MQRRVAWWRTGVGRVCGVWTCSPVTPHWPHWWLTTTASPSWTLCRHVPISRRYVLSVLMLVTGATAVHNCTIDWAGCSAGVSQSPGGMCCQFWCWLLEQQLSIIAPLTELGALQACPNLREVRAVTQVSVLILVTHLSNGWITKLDACSAGMSQSPGGMCSVSLDVGYSSNGWWLTTAQTLHCPCVG